MPFDAKRAVERLSSGSILDAHEKITRAIVTAQETARAARLDPPADPTPMHRFGYGAGLPLAILRAAWRDPKVKRKYMRTAFVMACVAMVITSFATMLGDELRRELHHGKKVTFHGLTFDVSILAFFSIFVANYYVVEFLVLMVAREHLKALQRDVALACGLPPEDAEITPRIHINRKWLFDKLKQKWRGTFVFGSIIPIAWLFGRVPYAGSYLQGLVFAAWGAYMSGVFTASKTAHAWKEENTARDPVYLRELEQLIARYWFFGWWGPRLVARLWRRFTRSVFSPAQSFERSPYELLGLAMTRTVRAFPGVSLFVRPLFSVAASHVVLTRRRELGLVDDAPTTNEAAAIEVSQVRIEPASGARVDVEGEREAASEAEAAAVAETIAKTERAASGDR